VTKPQAAVAEVTAIVLAACTVPMLRVTPPRWWLACMFLSSAVILAARVDIARTLRLTAILGIVLGTVYVAAHPQRAALLIGLCYGLGAASISAAFARLPHGPAAASSERVETALVVALFPVKAFVGVAVLSLLATKTPLTFDGALSVIDQLLGGSPSFTLGQLVAKSSWLHGLAVLVYDALPIAVMLTAGLRWRQFGRSDRTSVPLAAAIGASSGVLLYMIVPAAGPGFRWSGRFPFQPPTAAELSVAMTAVDNGAFRNAMPSLHFAGALFVAWGAWSLGVRARILGFLFLALTFVATLGLGEHYLIDLIVAVPFALAIETIVRRRPGWRRDFLISSGLTMAWLVAVRAATEIFVAQFVTWIAVTVTLFLCAWIGARRLVAKRVPALAVIA
jgi:PAP2 superfamily